MKDKSNQYLDAALRPEDPLDWEGYQVNKSHIIFPLITLFPYGYIKNNILHLKC